MPRWLELVVGACLGLFYVTWMYKRDVGSAPRVCPTMPPLVYEGMVVVPLGPRTCAPDALHLHHWMLLLPLLFLRKLSVIVRAFALVLVIQGLCYDDRFQMLCPNPYIQS